MKFKNPHLEWCNLVLGEGEGAMLGPSVSFTSTPGRQSHTIIIPRPQTGQYYIGMLKFSYMKNFVSEDEEANFSILNVVEAIEFKKNGETVLRMCMDQYKAMLMSDPEDSTRDFVFRHCRALNTDSVTGESATKDGVSYLPFLASSWYILIDKVRGNSPTEQISIVVSYKKSGLGNPIRKLEVQFEGFECTNNFVSDIVNNISSKIK